MGWGANETVGYTARKDVLSRLRDTGSSMTRIRPQSGVRHPIVSERTPSSNTPGLIRDTSWVRVGRVSRPGERSFMFRGRRGLDIGHVSLSRTRGTPGRVPSRRPSVTDKLVSGRTQATGVTTKELPLPLLLWIVNSLTNDTPSIVCV